MSGGTILDEVLSQFGKTRAMAERALEQTTDEHFFATLDAETNSIALTVKHMSGNMRSRWTDFLTTDGEKPDRRRDAEFEREAGDDRASVMRRWDEGWALVFAAVGPLSEADLSRTVTIRGEPHTVLQAIQRQLTHYAYHVGQIVLLARHFAGPRWQSLSIPRGKSAEFEVAKEGTTCVASPGARGHAPKGSDPTFGLRLFEAMKQRGGLESITGELNYAQIQALKAADRDEVLCTFRGCNYEMIQHLRSDTPEQLAEVLVRVFDQHRNNPGLPLIHFGIMLMVAG